MGPDGPQWKDQVTLGRLTSFATKYYTKILLALCGGFFFLAVLGKYSQLWTLTLNAQDFFWLFTDILEHGKRGAFFLTRFAPQSQGPVQHGVVHPMLTWGLFSLPAWLMGSTWTALLFNPLALAGAGFLVALLSRKRWGGPLFTLLCGGLPGFNSSG